MCALGEPLGDIGRIGMYALSFIIIIIYDSFNISIVIIIYYYYYYYCLEFFIVLH